jgi:hypothetical protein
MLHVAGAVDKDEQTDEGDHDEHDGCQRIEHPAELEDLVAEGEPCEVDGLEAVAGGLGEDMGEGAEREQERGRHGADGERCRGYTASLFEQSADARGEDGQGGNQPEVLNDPGHKAGVSYQ